MGLKSAVQGTFLKSTLTHLTDGNKGSNVLGAVAVSLLGSNLDYGAIAQGFHDEKTAAEVGKAAALVLMALWAYYIGKKKDNPEV